MKKCLKRRTSNQIISAMAEEDTRNGIDNRSFEERVFARFDAIDAWRATLDVWRSSTDGRFEGIHARLQALELQSEKRELETKPIWERALNEILEVKNGLSDLSRKIDVLSREMLTVKADQLRMDDRLGKLESKPS